MTTFPFTQDEVTGDKHYASHPHARTRRHTAFVRSSDLPFPDGIVGEWADFRRVALSIPHIATTLSSSIRPTMSRLQQAQYDTGNSREKPRGP